LLLVVEPKMNLLYVACFVVMKMNCFRSFLFEIDMKKNYISEKW